MAYEQHINDLLWTTCELNESNIEWPVPALASVSRCAAQPELENPHASHDTLYTDIGCYDGNAGTSIGSVWTMLQCSWSLHVLTLQCLTYCNRYQQDLWNFLAAKPWWAVEIETGSVSDHTRGECKSCCGVLQPSARLFTLKPSLWLQMARRHFFQDTNR